MSVINGTSGIDVLDGTSGDDHIYGFGGNDLLRGGSGNDVLEGGDGTDTLTGGAGNDVFQGTAGELNGDTITDFDVGDGIVITDATKANLSVNLSGHTLTVSFDGGSASINLSYIPPLPIATRVPEHSTGLEVYFVAPPPTIIDVPHSADFNNDGYDDVLWRGHDSSKELTTFFGQPNGSFAGFVDPYLTIPDNWHVVGTGDFNGDHYDDLLWRSDDGTTFTFTGQGDGTFVQNPNFNLNPGVDWHVQGTGDFNGDGRDDILWRSDNGAVVDLLGNADGSFTGNVTFNLNPGLDWHIQGTGDFNGDGLDDILWRNDAGTVVTLLGAPNGSFVGNVNLQLNPSLDWHIIGTGDVNGDSRDDILWRNDTGLIGSLLGKADGSFSGNLDQATFYPGNDWYVDGIGDYNGDGRADILLRDNHGNAIDWLGQPDGTFADNSATFDINPGTWAVQPEPALFI